MKLNKDFIRNTNEIIVLTVLLCIGINLFFGNRLIVGIVNGFILGGFLKISSYYFFVPRKFLPFLAFMPLFHYGQLNAIFVLLEILTLALLFMQRKVVFKGSVLIFPILIGLLLTFSGLISVKIISSDFTINWERSIYPQDLYELEIGRQQNESLYLPYTFRRIVFSEVNAYTYILIRNVFKFLSIDNLHRGLLLINVIFWVIGLMKFKELPSNLQQIFVGMFISTLFVIGAPKMPDTLSTLLAFRGFFVFLVLKGLASKFFPITINSYVIFWSLSMFIFVSLSI